jgi:predicted PurR-regulated permease PerM
MRRVRPQGANGDTEFVEPDSAELSGAVWLLSLTQTIVISVVTATILAGPMELAGLAISVSFTVLSPFFLLKDGPGIRRWLERHVGLPQRVARTISTRTIGRARADEAKAAPAAAPT